MRYVTAEFFILFIYFFLGLGLLENTYKDYFHSLAYDVCKLNSPVFYRFLQFSCFSKFFTRSCLPPPSKQSLIQKLLYALPKSVLFWHLKKIMNLGDKTYHWRNWADWVSSRREKKIKTSKKGILSYKGD